MIKKITIIWWSDWFGRWLSLYINSHFKKNVEITITWLNDEKLKEIKKENNFQVSTDNIKAVKEADIVIFSVPICVTEKVIKEVCPFIKEDSVVLDVTSIKTFPSKAMKKYSKKWVLVIPTHPMFWPYISTIAWQIFVLTATEEERLDKRYEFLKNFLKIKWAEVIESSPEEHDKIMAIVQWLTHFTMFVLWETIKEEKIDIEYSMRFVSPVYKLMISSVARYMRQNPKLYSDIQIYNTEVLKVHKTFMDVTNDFNTFVKEKDEKGFIKRALETQKYFWENASVWQRYTDKIIYMISRQKNLALQNIWKKIILENIYTKEEINWVLEKFEKDNLVVNGKNYDMNVYIIKEHLKN